MAKVNADSLFKKSFDIMFAQGEYLGEYDKLAEGLQGKELDVLRQAVVDFATNNTEAFIELVKEAVEER